MSLNVSDIDDVVQLTLNNFIKRGTFTNMQTDLTDFVAVREMWKNRSMTFAGGEAWEVQLQMDQNHTARTVGLFEQDSSSFIDTMTNAEIPVRYVNAYMIYDQREKLFQKGMAKIVDIIKTRKCAMDASFYELMEDQLWAKPVDSSDKRDLFGIPYWIVKNATVGLTGGNPSGFASGAGGVDSTAYPRWKNFSGSYTTVSKTDLVRKMRKAHRETAFRSPLTNAEPTLGGQSNGIYVNTDTISVLEELLEDQNMNLGNDIASKDGRTLFKGTPVTYAPKLDDDSSEPVYMIDWKWMSVGVQAGWQNNTTAPYMVPGKHTVRRIDMDVSANMLCSDRRRQTVLYKA